MSQKICVISFDHWNYDQYIVKELQHQGVESFHIKIGNFKYKNTWERIQNSLSKIFLGKNPKLKKRQDYILEVLKEKGHQNQILVINPELIDKEYHLKIKKFTDKYIAYLYDSVLRCPVEHLLNGVFDEIYSFDKEDISKYGFKETSNYIYYIEEVSSSSQKQNKKYDFVYIGSIDERLDFINELGEKLIENNKYFLFLSIGKKAFVSKLKQFVLGKNKQITFSNKRLNHMEMIEIYKQANCVLDIVRENQTGLSFRIFECIGIHANVLTTNKNISNYDLINSGKIQMLTDTIDIEFKEIYPFETIEKYSLKNWIKTVFDV